MSEVGSAFVSILPSSRGFGKALDSQIGGQVEASGTKSGGRFTSAIGSVLKKGAVGVGAAAGGVLGTALFKGFQRLNAIDQAEAKLSGLGHTTAGVDKIMTNALNSVKGTAFGLGDAATVAAGTVAAGVKPGQQLERTLSLVGDAATIAGTDLGSMGAIFNKVAASNKIQGDTIAQLNDAGIPIIKLLGQELGATAEETVALASAGKINFATFQNAMETGLGGAALKSGETFSGALANVGASLGRIGAGLLGGIFPHLAPMFQGITAALSPLESGAAKLGDSIGAKLGPALERVGPALGRFIAWVSDFEMPSFDFSGGGSSALSAISASFVELGGAVGSIDWSLLGNALGQGVADTVSVFSVVIGFAADNIGTFAKILPSLVVAFAAFRVAQAAANVVALAALPIQAIQIASNISLASSNRALAAATLSTAAAESTATVAKSRGVAATIASATASRVAAVAARVWAASQWLLNAALTANPIGLVVVAIAALVAGLVYAWRNSETFRKVVTTAWNAVRAAAVKVFGFIAPYVRRAIEVVRAVAAKVLPFVAAMFRTHFNAARVVVSTVMRVIGAVVRAGVAVVRAVVRGVSAVVDFFRSAFNRAREAVSGAFGRIREAVSTGITKVLGFIRELPGKAKAALGDLGGTLFSAGKELIDGLIRGISDRIGALGEKMSQVAGKVRGFLPGSPVREGPLMSWNNGGAGHRLVDLLALGLSDTRAVDAAMGNLTSRMTTADLTARMAMPDLTASATLKGGYAAMGPLGGGGKVSLEVNGPVTLMVGDQEMQAWFESNFDAEMNLL